MQKVTITQDPITWVQHMFKTMEELLPEAEYADELEETKRDLLGENDFYTAEERDELGFPHPIEYHELEFNDEVLRRDKALGDLNLMTLANDVISIWVPRFEDPELTQAAHAGVQDFMTSMENFVNHASGVKNAKYTVTNDQHELRWAPRKAIVVNEWSVKTALAIDLYHQRPNDHDFVLEATSMIHVHESFQKTYLNKLFLRPLAK
ncbi:hypothetical protein AUC43_15230 [Hymenobacter sedentarius]|uniref:Uncharacterized protein n=1 Tax=Hymenobacter sedentarius TaxID=1411621 RepID=A0A0U4BID4_9BACT|nr:hypothetical protein [Hymenobacter sedentarius]ALW86315.1 hypothetical protein AUC43_15230 [Hymenobacter sedentarius]